jgi:prephenate dehydratase
VVLAALAVKRLKIPKSTVHVAFSVKDEPGSLAQALKVFKDCNVNILGLNTHLHHAEFDRNAGNGYKFNYVHCMCTKDEKEFLKNELMAELKGGNIDPLRFNLCTIICLSG